MSFFKDYIDLAIDRGEFIRISVPGFILLLAVCALSIFIVFPKGKTEVTPAKEAVTLTTASMKPYSSGNGESIATVPQGSDIKIYATSGSWLWAEDSKGNRGYLPMTVLGNSFYLLNKERIGDSTYFNGSKVTLLSNLNELPRTVRTEDGTVGESDYPGDQLYSAEVFGIPSKGRNEKNISFRKFKELFKPGKSFSEIEGNPLFADVITVQGGKTIAEYNYAVFSDSLKKVYTEIKAVFENGILESVETGPVTDYTLAFRIIPCTESLVDMPVINAMTYKKPLTKTVAESPEDLAKIKLLDNPKIPGFISKVLKFIFAILLIAFAVYAVFCLLMLVQALIYPFFYIRYLPNWLLALIQLPLALASTVLLFMTFGPFIAGNSLGDMGKLWLLAVLFACNMFIYYKYLMFMLYNRCPSCGRMYTLYTTDESSVLGTSYSDETTYRVTKRGNTVIDSKALRTEHYKNTSFKDVLRCRRCGNVFSHTFTITNKIGTTIH